MPLLGMLKSMTGWWVGSRVAKDAYANIVEQARHPRLYGEMGVPDTVEGRVEMIAMHLFLFLERVRDEPSCAKLSQDLVNILVDDIEASLREMGVGDLSVGKKVQKHALNVYGRMQAYQLAWHGVDDDTMDAAITRNIFNDLDPDDEVTQRYASALSRYISKQMAALYDLDIKDLAQGKIEFLQ